ncbi:transmembrane exosortase (Exosortase_EpsH) superfamily [Roseibium sp. TrichSKD4]|uniref:exosortase T n=1 Tax=Roseibium sp. TrichSKD4 TaxID=744980 RepID=UPI0001E56A49|nr:exosortase T [Roseibium sp. TrichSKD4]EFO32528.1 transmembrane exosortase (Exosortase_EpsH) superfamily [Roseibium sp. TrichSKD4]
MSSTAITRQITTHNARLAYAGFAVASLILAVEPIRWLVATWLDPSYRSVGFLYLVALCALVIWSLKSGQAVCARSNTLVPALWMLVLAAALRLLGQVAAINVIGGVALAIDVYAIAILLRLRERPRPLSGFWLSVLFLFSLPFERIAQRVLGYPLQEGSANLACSILKPFYPDLICSGVRLQVSGFDVLVDLPCSGTSGLMLAAATVVALNAAQCRTPYQGSLHLIAGLALAVIGNAVRVSLLAVGIVHGPDLGVDVLARPLHDVIGLATTLTFLAPILCFKSKDRPPSASSPSLPARPGTERSKPALTAVSFLAILAAILITSAPRKALDVSRVIETAPLPTSLNGKIGHPLALTDRERGYFEAYGGTTRKMVYGPMAVTVVNTTSPLRHLHSPDECLRGLGYSVRFLGTRFEPVPTAIYRAEDLQGNDWKVSVSFRRDDGTVTSNVAEAIWQWLQAPESSWQSVMRITPWHLADTDREHFEAATLAALDLTPPSN